jgi:membrane protease YdiL (CAAX protease family)
MPNSNSARADLSAVVFALTFPSFATLVYFTLLAEAPAAVQYLAYAPLKLVQFGFPLLWVLLIQMRRPVLHRPRLEGLLPGALFGIGVMLGIWVLYRYLLVPAGLMDAARGPVESKIFGFGISSVSAYVALALFYSVFHSFLEEYYWRWFVFAELKALMRLGGAIVISSVGFMAHHVIVIGTFFGFGSPLTWFLSSCVAVGGAVWAGMYHRWGSLYPVWLGHFFVDAAIFGVGYGLVGGFS